MASKDLLFALNMVKHKVIEQEKNKRTTTQSSRLGKVSVVGFAQIIVHAQKMLNLHINLK